jgi:hypothetical protein
VLSPQLLGVIIWGRFRVAGTMGLILDQNHTRVDVGDILEQGLRGLFADVLWRRLPIWNQNRKLVNVQQGGSHNLRVMQTGILDGPLHLRARLVHLHLAKALGGNVEASLEGCKLLVDAERVLDVLVGNLLLLELLHEARNELFMAVGGALTGGQLDGRVCDLRRRLVVGRAVNGPSLAHRVLDDPLRRVHRKRVLQLALHLDLTHFVHVRFLHFFAQVVFRWHLQNKRLLWGKSGKLLLLDRFQGASTGISAHFRALTSG